MGTGTKGGFLCTRIRCLPATGAGERVGDLHTQDLDPFNLAVRELLDAL